MTTIAQSAHAAASPIFYAHRGAAAEQPENTLPSFARALELGAHALETDVHMSADGHIIVSHDPSGDRMTGTPLVFRRARLDEIRQLDAGYGFIDADGGRPFAGRGYQIPTLAEVLRQFPNVTLNVDIKQPWPPMVRQIIELIRSLDAVDRVLLASFHLRTIAAVRAFGYRGATALSQPEVAALLLAPRRSFRHLPLTGTRLQIPPRVGVLPLARRGFIEKCHRLGLRVDFWTINDAIEAHKLLDLGADGIMTDDPRTIAPVFANRGGSNGREKK